MTKRPIYVTHYRRLYLAVARHGGTSSLPDEVGSSPPPCYRRPTRPTRSIRTLPTGLFSDNLLLPCPGHLIHRRPLQTQDMFLPNMLATHWFEELIIKVTKRPIKKG